MSSPLSGFTAVPNPQMLAFMPIQSYLMMYFAGGGWQIGKRKISAIPNEEFNKMSINDLLKDFTADLKESIPTLESSLNDITPLVKILVEQYGEFIKEIIAVAPQTLETALRPTAEQIGIIPTAESTKHLPEASISNFFNALANMFNNIVPSLPSAEARLGPGISQEAIQEVESNIHRHTIEHHPIQLTAQQKQDAHNKAVAEAKALEIAQAKVSPFEGTKISTVHQTATQEFKPKAGQTQIIARTKLVIRLAKFSRVLKNLKASLVQSPPSLRNARQQSVKQQQINVNRVQTELTGLIFRYRWS